MDELKMSNSNSSRQRQVQNYSECVSEGEDHMSSENTSDHEWKLDGKKRPTKKKTKLDATQEPVRLNKKQPLKKGAKKSVPQTKHQGDISDINKEDIKSSHISDDKCDSLGADNVKKTETRKRKREDADDGIQSKRLKSAETNYQYSDYSTTDFTCAWNIVQEISLAVQWDERAIENTVKLLEDDNTIPFIARYRKEQTNSMEPDMIRSVKEKLDELKQVQKKVATILPALCKDKKLTPAVEKALKCARSLEAVEHLYAPYKPGAKGTLAARARERGLEPFATSLLTKPYQQLSLEIALKLNDKGLENLSAVRLGVQHIIADVVSKDAKVLELLRLSMSHSAVALSSSMNKAGVKALTEKSKSKSHHTANKADPAKYENYFEFSALIRNLRPHQVMAMNRGEEHKILTLKVTLPAEVHSRYLSHCIKTWLPTGLPQDNTAILQASFEDAYKRLLEPLMIREVRSKLKKDAEKASVEVFAQNVKRLLMTPPVRGETVLALDPGFTHGCKYAVIANNGQLLQTGVVYLHNPKNCQINKLEEVIRNNNCSVVAIGNGTACRETEKLVSNMITSTTMRQLNVKYCIVNESGASIYSASKVAEGELPHLDVSLRGAVSIGRRLQDPMAELVKIEPKHIGVGMYQHDCPEASLKETLDDVVEECVSFTGVDVNVCSEYLLRRIAGLKENLVKKILEYRLEHGGFICREELKQVKGLGPKTFEQAAGFVRILPSTAPNRSSSDVFLKKATKCQLNSLDVTSIHPECYAVAQKFLKKFDLKVKHIGKMEFIAKLQSAIRSEDISTLALEFNIGVSTMKLIVDGLQQPVDHDIREEFDKPLFKQTIGSLESVKVGDVLTGRVTNVTHFGAFVDVGVEKDGLIHSSKMSRPLGIGDHVEVLVMSLELEKQRLGLTLNSDRQSENVVRTGDTTAKVQSFKTEVTKSVKAQCRSIQSILVGERFQGTVKNIAHFGAFLDIGAERDGLVHTSKMSRVLTKDELVHVQVISVNIPKRQIGLCLV